MNVKQYIESHKMNIRYCEVVIDREGNIIEACPGHQQCLINLYAESLSVNYDQAVSMIPLEVSPVSYLVEKLGYISLWYDYAYIPNNLTKSQLKSLKELQIVGQITDVLNVVNTKEASKYEYFNNTRSLVESEIPSAEYFYFIDGKLIVREPTSY